VLVIDCTTIGAALPTTTCPIDTWRVARRGKGEDMGEAEAFMAARRTG